MWCIHLTFCTNQSVIPNHGVDCTIFDKFHHNIIYSKINICVPLPQSYVREVWDHKKVNIENIKKAISNFDWNEVFDNLSLGEKKKIKCDYLQRPWMTDNLKKTLKERRKLSKIFYINCQRKIIMIKFWKSLKNALSKIWKLKRTTFLKWPRNLQILIPLQKPTGPY